jgi:hypothetical protein
MRASPSDCAVAAPTARTERHDAGRYSGAGSCLAAERRPQATEIIVRHARFDHQRAALLIAVLSHAFEERYGYRAIADGEPSDSVHTLRDRAKEGC